MPADTPTRDGFSLRRWSRRKLGAARVSEPRTPAPPDAQPPATSDSIPIANASAAPTAPVPEVAPTLPPVDSLTIDSDFTAFLQPQVDESVKRQALKKLFADPRFNVMDGLDIYIGDYTKSEPIPPDVLERLMRTFTFNPPVPDAPAKDATAVSSSETPTARVPSETPSVAASPAPPEVIGTAVTPVPAGAPARADSAVRPSETDEAIDAPIASDVADPPASR